MTLRIAIAQILPTRDMSLRAEQVNTWLAKAAEARADVVVFPEVVWSVAPLAHDPEFLRKTFHLIEQGDRHCCSWHNDPSYESKMSAYSVLPTARAAENTIFVVSATPSANADDLHAGSHGRSRIIDPIGNTLAEGAAFGEQLVIADIDPEKATRHVALRALNDAGPLKDWIAEGVKLVQKR